MKTVLALSIAALALASTAHAQTAKPAQPGTATVQAGSRQLVIGKDARQPIATLQAAVNARDAAAFSAALPAAQAAAKTADERYAVASLRLQFAQAGTNKGEQIAAIEGMIGSGGSSPEQIARYNRAIAELAFETGKYDRSAQAFEELARANPNDSEVLSNLSIVQARRGKDADALSALDRAVAARKASGQAVPEDWYKRNVALATKLKNTPLALRANYDWVAAFPTASNWADALKNHQYLVPLDETGELDRLRLMRAAGALQGERSYKYMAEVLLQRGFPGEAKAVLDEGVTKNQINRSEATFAALIKDANARAAANRSTLAGSDAGLTTARQLQGVADANYGFGNYTKAAELYRRAIAAGGGDASLLNLRLGMSLALAGDKAGAQTALAAVTSGPRADLARYWTLWTNSRA